MKTNSVLTISNSITNWAEKYSEIRNHSVEICRPLEIEDYVVQPIVDVSPPKWHLGHTTWFSKRLFWNQISLIIRFLMLNIILFSTVIMKRLEQELSEQTEGISAGLRFLIFTNTEITLMSKWISFFKANF